MGQIKNIKLHIVTDIKYMMSDRRSRKVAFKKKKKKSKRKFLLTSKKCWLIEEKLIPLYQHLVDNYSVKLREEWDVKVEETDVEVVQQVKEEPQEDYLVDSQQLQLSSRMNQLESAVPDEDHTETHGDENIPSTQKKHRCNICDKTFPTPSKLSR